MTALSETHQLDGIEPEPREVILASGVRVYVSPMKTRQLLRLLRIITRGAGSLIMQYPLDFNDEEALTSQLLALTVMAIPEAEDETIDFVRSIVEPAGLESGKDQATAKRNAVRYEELGQALENPELEDLMTVVEVVLGQERENLTSLGKRLTGLVRLAREGKQDHKVKETPVEPEPAPSSRPSRARSTSSQASTDGQTTPSLTSPSLV